jgi:8-oxo-dGTP pyrophosphatase MutT (NUDIX family)
MQPYCTSFWKHRDDEYRYDIFLVYDFSNLQDIKQVYAFVLSKDRKRMLVVYDRGGMHILPGGGVEKGENNMDTLVREVKEETNREVDINTATPFFYQKAYRRMVRRMGIF